MAKKKRLRMDRVILAAVLALAVIGCAVGIVVLKKHYSKPKDQPTDNPVINTDISEEMTQLYYYDETRKERYISYQAAHPELSTEEIVWRVDADIDLDPYTNIQTIDPSHADDEVLLVNKHFRLSDDYEPAELSWLDTNLYLTPNALHAYLEMASGAALADLDITAGSTYRSVSYQADLYQTYVNRDGQAEADTYSARAGSSEHHTGRAIDMVGPDGTLDSFETTPECQWIHEHAYEYGFILRYQKDIEDITGYIYEPWHLTYIGKEAAKIMHDQNIPSLEEYYVKYVMFTEEKSGN